MTERETPERSLVERLREKDVPLLSSGSYAETRSVIREAATRLAEAEARERKLREAATELVEEVGFFLRSFDVGKPYRADRMRDSMEYARAALTDTASAGDVKPEIEPNYDALEQIENIIGWIDAYPERVFTPLSKDEEQDAVSAAEAAVSNGSARLHASWARHILGGIRGYAENARRALADEGQKYDAADTRAKPLPSGVVEVCPLCDIAGCRHIRERTGPFAEKYDAAPSAGDVRRRALEAAKLVAVAAAARWKSQPGSTVYAVAALKIAEELDALSKDIPASIATPTTPTVEAAREDELRRAAAALSEIVEGVTGFATYGTWRAANGTRLKDTQEWVRFYVALRALSQQEGGENG